MLPSNESFPAGNGPGSQIEFGLEDEVELVPVESATHAVVELEALNGLRRHLLREEAERVAAPALGCVHGRIGILDERFRIVAMVGKDADSDAARDVERIPVEIEGRPEITRDPFGNNGRIAGRIDRPKSDQELIAAQPGNRVFFAGAGLESLRDALEQFIAPRVAKTIVDDLEAIDVEVEHAERLALCASRRRRPWRADRARVSDWAGVSGNRSRPETGFYLQRVCAQ